MTKITAGARNSTKYRAEHFWVFSIIEAAMVKAYEDRKQSKKRKNRGLFTYFRWESAFGLTGFSSGEVH